MTAKTYLPHRIADVKIDKSLESMNKDRFGLKQFGGLFIVEGKENEVCLYACGRYDQEARENNLVNPVNIVGEGRIYLNLNDLTLEVDSRGDNSLNWHSAFRFSRMLSDYLTNLNFPQLTPITQIDSTKVNPYWFGDNLRNKITERATLKTLKKLLEEPFEFDEKDSRLMNIIGEKYRHKQKQGYDYSPESRIFLSLCYHELKFSGVSEPTLQKFEELIDIIERGYILAPNSQRNMIDTETGKTFKEMELEKVKELNQSQEHDLILYKLKWVNDFMEYVDKCAFGEAERRDSFSSAGCGTTLGLAPTILSASHPINDKVNFLDAYHCNASARQFVLMPFLELNRTFSMEKEESK